MEALFGAIIGGSISILITIITLRWNQKIHESNLQEERLKIKEEREFIAKKDSLVIACKALTHLIDYYFLIPDKNLPKDGNMPQVFEDLNIAFNQLHFYCSMETIEKSSMLNKILSKAFMEAISARLKVGFVEVDIDTTEIEISNIEKMNNRMQDEINAILHSAPESPIIGLHRKTIADNYEKSSDLYDKKCELIKLKFIETEKCRDIVYSNAETIYEALMEVLLIARKELSFPIKEDEYKRLIINTLGETGKVLKNFLSDIREQVSEKIKETED